MKMCAVLGGGADEEGEGGGSPLPGWWGTADGGEPKSVGVGGRATCNPTPTRTHVHNYF